MEKRDYLSELMAELTPSEFLQITMKKLEKMEIEKDEDLTLADKIAYKLIIISRDAKLKKMTAPYKEKVFQFMEKLKETDLAKMLETEKAKLSAKSKSISQDDFKSGYHIPEPKFVASKSPERQSRANLPEDRSRGRSKSRGRTMEDDSYGRRARSKSRGRSQQRRSRFHGSSDSDDSTGRKRSRSPRAKRSPDRDDYEQRKFLDRTHLNRVQEFLAKGKGSPRNPAYPRDLDYAKKRPY